MPNGAPWPRFTIVTPSFNQGDFLEETIRSVLLQNYPNLEYVVLDGGSTDGSLDVIRRYQGFLSAWSGGPDGGQADAVARGFAGASGELLAWINSDDYYLPGAFASVARRFHSPDSPLWVVGGYQWVDARGKLVCKHYASTQDFASLLCAGQRFGQPACFWRAEAYRGAGGIDTSLRFCFDYDLFLKLARRVMPARLPRMLAAYRDHAQTKSATIGKSVGAQEAAAVRERHGIGALEPSERERIVAQTLARLRRSECSGLAADIVRDPWYPLRRLGSAVRDGMGRRV